MQIFLRGIPTATIAALVLGLSGCTSLPDYVHNGFKVGPNCGSPRANVASQWIDAADIRVRSQSADLSRWWCVFNDPTLDGLVHEAYSQNLTLKEAGTRILQARAQLGIAEGGLFPQSQSASGGYNRTASTANPNFPPVQKFSDQWNAGFSLAWELDFWGRFRRSVLAAEAQLDSSIESYDDALVTLLGDVATNYVQIRQLQEQIHWAQENVRLQREVLKIVQSRLDAGRISELDVDQAQSTLAQTAAQIPQFKIGLRQAQNRLCILLGIPPTSLEARLGNAAIPTAPAEVAVGIPAELLQRRPDIRRAERNAAAQAQQIGIARSDLYPHISITGTIGYTAQNLSQLFAYPAFNGSAGPSFQWNVLNYGRIASNINLQDAKFQETVLIYRNTVLRANEEAENGLIAFLSAQQRAKLLTESVTATYKAYKIVVSLYRVGTVDFNRVVTIEQNLVQQADLETQARGQIATGLIQVYRALGGGWQIRLGPTGPSSLPQPPTAPAGAERGLMLIPNPEPPGEPGLVEPPQAPLPPRKDQGK